MKPWIELLAGLLALTAAPLAAEAAPAEHAILFVIDGLSYKAIERLPLNNIHALIATGTYFEKSYNLLPAHFHSGPWAKFSTCSIPNPVLLAGTALLEPGQKYVQQSFFPDRVTAHVVNELDYVSINVGFHLTFMGNVARVRDEEAMGWAIDFLRKQRPAFMLVHLMDTGNAGERIRSEKDPSVPWRGNIWAEGSPYRQAAVRADQCLGRFLDELKSLGLREKTALFVTADHGQSDHGWHPYQDADTWAMPLVLAGAGIRGGQRFPYAEATDIVPTLCALAGVKPPANSDGVILNEALLKPAAAPAARRHRILELDQLLVEGEARIAAARGEAQASPALRAKLEDAKRNFYGIDRILEWRKFRSLDDLMAHNRAVLEALRAKE
ncbi:MAG TPA: alkaline phosphatase family protein [Bryobacterales bacterium]|nr:alkaline phosphatase family protein [Bryobacterales bacterium]